MKTGQWPSQGNLFKRKLLKLTGNDEANETWPRQFIDEKKRCCVRPA